MDDRTEHQTDRGTPLTPGAPLDEATVQDLNLDAVIEALDTTRSTPGQAVFSGWLKAPCTDLTSLDDRRTLVEFFRSHPEARAKAGRILSRLGKQTQGDLAAFLVSDPEVLYQDKAPAVSLLAAAELAVCAGSLLLGPAALLVFLVVCLVNLGVYLRTTRHIGRSTGSIAYLAKVLSAAGRLGRVLGSGTTLDHRGLDRGGALSRKIPFTVALFLPSASAAGDLASAFFEYYRIFLLGEIRAYLAFHRALRQYRGELRTTFDLVGKVDATLCLLDLEESDLPTTEPDFTAGRGLSCVGLVHPLIPGFVPLSVTLDRGAIVTGTNMAGKSTFLRTLGLNQVLATGLKIALAQKYHSSFARVMTALEITDDLVAGKSRYLAQAERILAVIAACEQEPVFALIDEILSGTNSRDRIQASVAILRHLASTTSLVVSSTHDREIAEAVGGLYTGLYFSEILDDKGLEFDYQIHPGIVDRSNALRILDHLGFGRYLR